ncbi:MAG: DUF4232 domain-containing protein, partial [Frankiales bacterium]|nr:DUF4232 domain-containing protein [Frankiales bacterium]
DVVRDGVRRRRQRRNLSVLASAVATVAVISVSALALNGSHGSRVEPGGPRVTPTSTSTPAPKPSATDTGSPSSSTPWASIPYDASKPVAWPGTIADPRVPWCTAAQLTATADGFQGATGSAAGAVTVVNQGARCALQGVPVVTGYSRSGAQIATPMPVDSFQLHRWVLLRPRSSAFVMVQIFGDNSRCRGPVARLSVAIGHGGPALSVVPHDVVAGRSVGPRCGTAAPATMSDTYSIGTGAWLRDGQSDITGPYAEVDSLPHTVLAGTVLRFQVLVRGLQTDPCPAYREQLVTDNAPSRVVADAAYYVNCQAIGDPSAPSQLLAMQLAVPSNAPAGLAELSWELPVGDSANVSHSVRIVAPPPPCRQSQLSIKAGRTGVGLGSYYDRILFTNVSSTTCSLFGYPGVQFESSSGQPLPTTPTHGSSYPVETVVLRPGGVASDVLSGADSGPNGGATACTRINGVRIIAPGLTTQVLVHAAMDCNHGTIRVTAVVSGPNASP